jgi:hypothetical protein
MFIGHFALGFAAKKAAPHLSLGSAFLGAQFVDLLWPTLLLAGVESVRIAPGASGVTPLAFDHYPVSHSLLAALAWALVVGGLYLAARGHRRGAVVLGLLVLSHWLLDALVHVPDLPLAPGLDARIGFGLWTSLPATLAVEVPLFVGGVALYANATRPQDRIGRWGLVGLVALLLVIYAGNLFGPPPPSATAIAWVGQAQWLLVAFGYWVDDHRAPPAFASGRHLFAA